MISKYMNELGVQSQSWELSKNKYLTCPKANKTIYDESENFSLRK